MVSVALQLVFLLFAQQGGVGFPKVSAAWIVGTVRSQAGDPIAGAVVLIRFDHGSDLGGSAMSPQTLVTRRNGAFTQRIAGEGYFEVCATVSEQKQCQIVEVEKGKEADVAFEF